MGYLDNKGLEKYTWNVRNRVAKNDQMTKPSHFVSFCPAPETELEPIVNFSFRETMPAEGEKGPNNPSTISGISSIKLSRCGKNIIAYPYSEQASFTREGVTYTTASDGSISLSNTATGRSVFYVLGNSRRIRYYPGDVITVSGTPQNAPENCRLLFERTRLDDSYIGNYSITKTNLKYTFTAQDEGYFGLSIVVNQGVDASGVVFRPQIEIGSKSTSYEPYSGNAYEVELGDTYYAGSINIATGEMTVTHHCWVWNNMNFGDPESYNSESGYAHFNYYSRPKIAAIDFPNSANVDGYYSCSHFPTKSVSSYQAVSNGTINYPNIWFIPDGLQLRVVAPFQTKEEFNTWINEQYAAGTPVTLVYKLATPETIQLTPTQIKSISSLNKYSHPINTVYTDQKSVQVGWIREDFIHKSGNETIGGLKIFKNSRDTSVAGDKTTTFVVRNPAVERGIRRADGSSYSAIIFADNEGDIDQTYDGRLGIIEVCSPKTGINERIYLECYKYSSNSTDYAKNVRLEVGYDLNEIPYALAPETSDERTNSTDIVTRGYMEASEWNWQKTKKAEVVTFKPVPESDLEPVVDFMFTEIPPAEGEKSLENPSTITGVTQTEFTYVGKNLFPKYIQAINSNVITITINNDGSYTLNGTTPENTSWFGYFFNVGLNANLWPVWLKHGHTYTFSMTGNSDVILQFYTYHDGGFGSPRVELTSGETKTYTIPNDTGAIVRLMVKAGTTLTNATVKVQIEESTYKTDWEQQVQTTYTIPFGDTYYGGSIDVSTGILTQTYAGLVLNGTETWSLAVSGGTYNGYRMNISPMAFGGVPLQSQYQKEKCTHFNVSNGQSTEHMHFIAYGIRLEIYSDQPTVEDFKTWLAGQSSAGTPVTVVYPISEPRTIQLTPTQIKALASNDKYSPKINTIYTNAASVQVGYQRYADENAKSASKLQSSVSLTTNLASTTAIAFDGSTDQNSIPVSGVLSISNGGTGSNTQNFVDLSNSQVINGVKTFGSTIEGVVDRSIKDGSGNVIVNTYATKATATSLTDGLMSSTDKSKLDSIGTVFNFKGTVADTTSLPGSGNTAGDVYLVQSPLGLQAWNGTSWVDIGSSALLPISDSEIDAVFV